MNKKDNVAIEMLESYQSTHKLIPFIGAGFSKNIDNYPNWNGFIKILEHDLISIGGSTKSLNGIFNSNNLEIAEYYIWKKGADNISKGTYLQSAVDAYIEGKTQLLKKMQDLFNPFVYDPLKWKIHNNLTNKFKDLIYTTNWDDTLEKSNGRSDVKPTYKVEHLKSINTKPTIIKFHGHFEDYLAESLIASETDYLKRMSTENPFDIKLKNDLLHHDFIFLGYSFNDPNIKLVIHQINQIFFKATVKHKPKVYWVSTDYDTNERVEMLSKSTMNIIKPYFLLEKHDQAKLVTLENRIKTLCDPCSNYWKCNNKLCSKYSNQQKLASKHKEDKSKILKKRMEELIDFFH